MSKKIKAKLLIEVETDFDDNISDEDTVAFCIEEDLEDLGWQVNEVKVYKEDD